MKISERHNAFTVSIVDSSYLISFMLLFVCGGAMAFIGIPFRPFMIIVFAFLLIFYSKIKVNSILYLYFLLLFEILISALLNKVSPVQLVLFLRNLIFSFMAYYLVDAYFTKKKSHHTLLKWCSILGLIQLPIIIFQKVFYNQLIKISAEAISYWDIGSGTFFIKNDSAMSIFLVGLIIIYLFNKNLNDRYKVAKTVIFILAIFAAGSRILQLTTLVILAFFFLRNLSVKVLIYLGLLFLIGVLFLINSPVFIEFYSQMTLALRGFDLSNVDPRAFEKFEDGQYSRAAAVLYYLAQPFKFFGDGPSAYYDVITREHTLGNTGHIFTFYSEVGSIGLALSYWIYYEFCKFFSQNRLQRLIYFFAICMLSITSNIYTDTGIVFAFLTMLSLQNITSDQETRNV